MRMNAPEIMAAKMICKSIDALTREVYLLRKEMKMNIKTEALSEAEEEPPLIEE